jgi:hydroxyethylthiazole kinase-like uncharacterized protein yjeF
MLKILAGDQVRELDQAHIERHGMNSIDLMEKAASGFINWWKSKDFDIHLPIHIFCGAGNNGGDGFAIARILFEAGYHSTVYRCYTDASKMTVDASRNLNRIPSDVSVKTWEEFDAQSEGILIDSFLGVGLKGELKPTAAKVIAKMNEFQGVKISVDIPSGMPSDQVLLGPCVIADYTVTFAFPKLSLLFPEHAKVTGEMVLVDIGIDDSEYTTFDSPYFYVREKDIPANHRMFHRFSHKGDFGKVLIIAGSRGKMGAAILSCKAALRTGSGLVTGSIPEEERLIFQTAAPEAMCTFTLADELSRFDAIGVGPGIGVDSGALLKTLFDTYTKPVVIDADAISILAKEPDLISRVPKGSIFTPHVAEFDRLLGASASHLERLRKASEFCQRWKMNILIKGANSVICLADGRQFFNSSGTHYMATGGSGDVLTGMLTSFLGQGYTPEEAMICGVFHHGLAGEIAGKRNRRGTIASDIIEAIPETFVQLGIA